MTSHWTQRHTDPTPPNESADQPAADDRAYQRDRARVIHSSSFRSLQSKTQVLGLGESDFYRTRLTHSLEVAQIGSGICERLKFAPEVTEKHKAWIPSFSLIEAICLAHDIGHPPFGHGGETATNYLMREQGGFEANGQTLRILTRLGEYSERDGLNLTRRSLLGIIKYPAFYDEVVNPRIAANTQHTSTNIDDWTPPKCIFREEEPLLHWILEPFSSNDTARFRTYDVVDNHHGKTRHKAFDTTIMELADDIAYGVHDLEDAITLNFLDRHLWINLVAPFLQTVDENPVSTDLDFYTQKLFSGCNKDRKHAISKLVAYFIASIDIQEDLSFSHPLLRLQARMTPTAFQLLHFLKQLVMVHVILKPELQALQFKGQRAIIKLFEAFSDNPRRLLPQSVYRDFEAQNGHTRIICDYIASMTDVSASRLYHKLFSPSAGSMFDRL